MKLIVITLDGLHPGYLGCYGNEWIETSTLDRWAAEGIVFDQHFADQPDAMGARRAWRTGCFRFSELTGNDLPRELIAHGVVTTLVTDAQMVSDFHSGWQTIHKADGTEATIKLAVKTIRQLADQDRWLLWLDLGGLLPPWEPSEETAELYFDPPEESDDGDESDESAPWSGPLPERVAEADDGLFLRLQRTFAASVSAVDAGLGVLAEHLDKRGLLDKVAVMTTSGHGLTLGEHTHVSPHLHSLHEELVHVPLILRLPGNAHAGRRVSAFTQSVDLLPTIRELFELPPMQTDGCGLMPLAYGTHESVRPFAVSGWARPEATHWAIRTPTHACLVTHSSAGEPTARLYIKPDDRWEMNDMAQHFSENVVELESTLRQFIDTTRRH